MNLLTVLLGVLGGSLVLAALSWKWCLPGRKTSAIIVLATVVAFGCGWLALRAGWWWWLVLGASGAAQLLVYVGTILWIFYLDPERKVPSDPHLVLSPADGTVVYIRQLKAGEPLRSDKNGAAMILDEFNATDLARTPLWQIGVSMVFTDVHVNRSPIRGKVTLLKHRPGQFLSLRHKDALNLNERQTMVITGNGTQIGLVQIASRLVRQIVAYVDQGQEIAAGQRVGMIKFGSQVDLFLPRAQAPRLAITEGQRLIAGETVVCRLAD